MTYFEGGDLHSLSRDVREALIGATSVVRDLPRATVVATRLAI